MRLQAKTGLSKVLPAVASGLEQTAVQDGGEGHGARTKAGLHGKTHPSFDGKVKKKVPNVPGSTKGTWKAVRRSLSKHRETVSR